MRLLIVSSRFPYPLEKGDKLRLYHQIRYLSEFHEIFLVSVCHIKPSAEHRAALEKYCKKVIYILIPDWKRILGLTKAWFTNTPFQIAWFYDRKVKRRVRKLLLEEDIDHIYCQLIRMSEYVRTFPLPKTIDYMDALGKGLERRADKTRNPVVRRLYRKEARRVRQYEQKVWKFFDHHVIISERDKTDLGLEGHLRADVIPNGVDLEYFAPPTRRKPIYDIIFTGNMGYGPNIEAVRQLVNWTSDTLVDDRHVTISIAGARPDNQVLKLANDRVDVAGWLDDIRDAYNSGKVFGAPIFTGSGLQNKILEAMAMGVPCVTTDMVNASIGAKKGVEILIANNREDFNHCIKQLLTNKDLHRGISLAGREFVYKNYSWERFNEGLNELLNKPVPKHGYSTFTGRNG